MSLSLKALYPGSFDPITKGHIDLIRRMSTRFDELIVLIANSAAKSYTFSGEERKSLVERVLHDVPRVKVEVFDGLTVDYAKKVGATTILRGLRAVSDFEYEFAMAGMNRKLNPEIETVIVFTSPEYAHISSRMVKEIASHNGRLTDFVPELIAQELKKKLPTQ